MAVDDQKGAQPTQTADLIGNGAQFVFPVRLKIAPLIQHYT